MILLYDEIFLDTLYLIISVWRIIYQNSFVILIWGGQGMININADTIMIPTISDLKSTENNDACTQASSISEWKQEYFQLSSGVFKGTTKEIHVGNIQI